MASSKDYFEYVLELLREVRGISYRKMMGEYMLYKDGVIFGGVYDDRFLVKKIKGLEDRHFKEVIPYPNASPFYLVDVEDPDEIKDIVDILVKELR